jgi:hypothetical protein
MLIFVDGTGVLTMDRVGGGNGALVRNIPFPGPPTSLLVKFDFNVTSYRRGSGGVGANYVNFNVGTNLDTAAGRPSGGFAKFGIGFFRTTGVDSGWFVNNINSGTVSGLGVFRSFQTITFAVNGSGGPLTYTAPTGASETVADQMWDLWVGTSKEFDEQPILDNTQIMSTFKIVFGSASNTVAFDNLVIDPLVTTGVDRDAPVPQTMTLEQNYPNPFNPSTTIRYGLPQKSEVDLAVFNALGQRVATVVQGEQEAGYHEVKFSATGGTGFGGAGFGLPSGVYFYRLQAVPIEGGQGRNIVATKKLVILK